MPFLLSFKQCIIISDPYGYRKIWLAPAVVLVTVAVFPGVSAMVTVSISTLASSGDSLVGRCADSGPDMHRAGVDGLLTMRVVVVHSILVESEVTITV